MNRGSVKKAEAKLLTVWVPEELVPFIDVGVKKEDSDRSKFIRNAIREKLTRCGVAIVEVDAK